MEMLRLPQTQEYVYVSFNHYARNYMVSTQLTITIM